MSFIEEIKEIEKQKIEKETLVINEIIEYFKKEINSDEYKKQLKNKITYSINMNKNEFWLHIEFWEYKTGCSSTHISCGGCIFKLESEEYYYKGIRLIDISKNICDKLSKLLQNRLKELGLKVIKENRRDDEYRYNYYKNELLVKW